MVNYNDPVIVAQDYMALVKLWHALAGLYLWEFVTTLDYEWSVFRRHRPFRWTILIYFTTRIATLLVVVLYLVQLNVTAQYNCEVNIVLQLIFGYLGVSSASLLIVLRVLAVWNKKKVIIAIAAGAWGISVLFHIQSIVRTRGTRIPGLGICHPANIHLSVPNILVTLATDITLLLIMFFGLRSLGFHERGAFGLGRLLWKQGVIWLFVASISEALAAIFLCLNLNEPLNAIFLSPSLVTLTIAASRIHRSLTDYASGCTKHMNGLDTSERSGRIECKANRVPIITLSRMEVAINRTSDQDQSHQTPQTSQNGSLASIEGQLCEKPGRQHNLDESAENDVESQT